MKNIFLSVVIICALTIAGVGGTLANLSDSEESLGNKIEVGSLDLKVNGTDDIPWGTGVDPTIELECVLPGTWRTETTLENEGCIDGFAYIHFKLGTCYNTDTHADAWYPDPVTPYNLKPEPELVAEYGGWVDQVEVDGIGRIGDNCSMYSTVRVTVKYGPKPAPMMPGPAVTVIDDVEIGSLDCYEILLGELPGCGETYIVDITFTIPQWNESKFGKDFFDPGSKWEHWPTNALMADGLPFDIMFELHDHLLNGNAIG